MPSWEHSLQVKTCKFHWKNRHFLFMAFLGCAFRVPLPFHVCWPCSLHVFLSKFAGFFQKVLPALGGEHIFQTNFKRVVLKISLFWCPYAPYKNDFYHFWSLLWLHCSFASLFVRSRPPSKNACGSSPVLILPPRPHLHKRPHASHLQFSKFRVLSAVFFVPAVLYTHVFRIFLICFASLLPAVTIAFVIFLAEVLPALQSPIVHRLPFCSSCICVPSWKLKGGGVPSPEGLQLKRDR